MGIDFRELPKTGNSLEQLARELLLASGVRAQWTGEGPDAGRDIMADETATGPIGSFRRRWLVQCKHKAHNNRSLAVGRNEVGDFAKDCRQIGAEGYLLVCSTHPSAGLVTTLRETAENAQNHLVTDWWDAVELEKRLTEPRGFAISHLFFPRSMEKRIWNIYNGGTPSRWAAHYKDQFLYLASRISSYYPTLQLVERILEKLTTVPINEEDEFLRPRAVFFDDKHTRFNVFADYLVPRGNRPSLKPIEFERILRDGQGLCSDGRSMWYLVYWDIRMVHYNPHSDRFDTESSEYYDDYMSYYDYGVPRGQTIGERAEHDFWW